MFCNELNVYVGRSFSRSKTAKFISYKDKVAVSFDIHIAVRKAITCVHKQFVMLCCVNTAALPPVRCYSICLPRRLASPVDYRRQRTGLCSLGTAPVISACWKLPSKVAVLTIRWIPIYTIFINRCILYIHWYERYLQFWIWKWYNNSIHPHKIGYRHFVWFVYWCWC